MTKLPQRTTLDEGNGQGGPISRRSLLQAGGAITLAGAFLGATASAADAGGSGEDGSDFDALRNIGAKRESYWKEGGKYFQQKNVDMSRVDQNLIRARVEGEWKEFVIREIDDAFFDFNIAMRIRMLDVMLGKKPYDIYNDAHNAAVGTYGSNRGDSRFTVNVAFKGMGWVPGKDKIDERAQLYLDNFKGDDMQSMMKKIDILSEGYYDPELWDRRLLGSLELYTAVDNETHTFLNQMVNPVSTLCTLGDQSYEMRAIARLMHPKDPDLTEYEKKIVKWINFAHDFFHGGPSSTTLTVHNIGVAYFIVEEFDNSPFGATDTAGGQKRVPIP